MTLQAAALAVLALAVNIPSTAAPADLLSDAAVDRRIARYRCGQLSVDVRDRAGRPVEGATVEIRQTRHSFLFGANIYALDLGSSSPAQQQYQKKFTDLLNYATLPFYWGAFEGSKGRPGYKALIEKADWCHAHGLTTKGHPLVWHQVYPTWAPTTAEQTRPLIEQRIKDLIPRLRHQIDYWDVVNEANVAASDASGIGAWARQDGPVELVASCLAWAREANRGVGATLLYNDYRTGSDNVALLQGLRQRGQLPDAIGIQSHMHGGVWEMQKVWDTVERFSTFGLPVHFTEVTVLAGANGSHANPPKPWPATPEGEAFQGDYVEKLYRLLFSHPSVEAITWWDFGDSAAWLGAPAGFVRADGSSRPVYDRLKKLIKQQWWTDVRGRTLASGRFSATAFYGDYELSASAPSRARVSTRFSFKKSNRGVVTLTLP